MDCGAKDAPECVRWERAGLCSDDLYNVHCANICGFCKKEVQNVVEVEEREF